MRGEWEQTLDPKALAAFTTAQGAVYGVPMKVDLEIALVQQGPFRESRDKKQPTSSRMGIFVEAIKKFKAAGITPIAVGGREKWPLHFYWTMLALRLGGKEAFEAAFSRAGEGFAGPVFVQSAELFKQLVDLKPFQPDFLRANYRDAAAYFGDGKAAMHFMGPFDYGQPNRSARTAAKAFPKGSSTILPSRWSRAGRVTPTTRWARSLVGW